MTLLSLILQYTACICTASHYDCEGELGCSSGDGTIYHTAKNKTFFTGYCLEITNKAQSLGKILKCPKKMIYNGFSFFLTSSLL